MPCLFCTLIEKKETPLLFESDQVVAFHDIHPVAPVHILIIPKKHIATLNDTTPKDSALLVEMIQTAKVLAAEYNIADTGYRIFMNCNADGGQEIYHIHLHLIGGKPL